VEGSLVFTMIRSGDQLVPKGHGFTDTLLGEAWVWVPEQAAWVHVVAMTWVWVSERVGIIFQLKFSLLLGPVKNIQADPAKDFQAGPVVHLRPELYSTRL